MAILQHALGMFINHKAEWQSVRDQKSSVIQVFVGLAPFLVLIPAVSSYIGVTQVGWAVAGGNLVKLTTESAVSLCVLTYFSLLAAIFVLGKFTSWMSKTYGVEGDAASRNYRGTALAVYTATPVMIAGIANLYPNLWFVATVMGVAGAYSVYLIYQGIPILMDIPKDRAFFYASSVVTVGIVLMITIIMATVVIWGMGVGPIYVD